MEEGGSSLLSGVPVLIKPETATSLLAHRMVEDVVNAGIFPEGSLSLVCGGGHDLLSYVKHYDAVLFTGSADTAFEAAQ